MQAPLNNTNPQPNTELKHSSIGIASFVMVLFADFFLLMSLISSVAGGDSNNPALAILIWILIIPSTVLAIVDLNLPNRKKKLPKLALSLGIGLIGILFVLALILAPISILLFNRINR
jgi:hypothetical protein